MLGFDRAGLKGISLTALTEDEVDRIHAGAGRILEQMGITIFDTGILAILDETDCRVDHESQHAYFPKHLIKDALTLAPSEFTLYNRLGQEAISLGSGSFYTRVSSGATGILDLDTNQRREPTTQDAVEAIQLADALPHIHGVSTMAVQPASIPVTNIDLEMVKLALANTVKPLGYVCLNEATLNFVLEMFAAVVGGEDNLREKPIVTALAESTSPLKLVPSQMKVLKAFAERGLPLTLHAHPIAGLSAPVTLAGELVVTHAEVLALGTITQLIRPGTPIVYGMSSSVPDMRKAINLSGAVEIGLLGTAVAQLARKIGLPAVMSSGTDAFIPGGQSMFERLMTLWPPAFAGIDLINLSTLETKMTFSPLQLVLDDMMLSFLARFLRGIKVDEETLAFELISELGSEGGYVSTEHTLRHFRNELLTLDLISHEPRETWQTGGRLSLPDRAREKVRHILASHQAPPLADRVLAQLDEIALEANAAGGQ